MNRLPRGCANVGGPLASAMEECRKVFLSLFQSHGYQLFLPSALQLLESTWDKLPVHLRQKLITVNTPFGEPCCLRGDLTLAAVAYLASHFAPEERPLRICYSDRIYMRTEKPQTSIESFQLGAEIIGWQEKGADVELLSLLLRLLDGIGLEKTVLVLGDATFLQRAVSAVETATAESLVQALQQGSLTSYFSILEKGDIPDYYRRILSRIPDLRGGPEILGEASRLWGKGDPLSSMREIVASLQALGFGNRIKIDLSLVRELGYYSGPLFDVYSESSGQALGGGGRYDRLLSSCGQRGQATGFALNLERIASLSRFRDGVVLVSAWWGNLPPEEALRRASALAVNGGPLEICWDRDRDESIQKAWKRGCSSWMDLASGDSVTSPHFRRNGGGAPAC